MLTLCYRFSIRKIIQNCATSFNRTTLSSYNKSLSFSCSSYHEKIVSLQQFPEFPVALLTIHRGAAKNAISKKFMLNFDECILQLKKSQEDVKKGGGVIHPYIVNSHNVKYASSGNVSPLSSLALQKEEGFIDFETAKGTSPPPPRILLVWSTDMSAFCAGADLKERSQMSEYEIKEFVLNLRNSFHDLYSLPLPTIACMDGIALGGGLELALACDFRIASQSGLYGLPETSLGIIPGAGGMHRLSRLIGVQKAKSLVLFGKKLSGKKALKWGIVDFVAGINEDDLGPNSGTSASSVSDKAEEWMKNFSAVVDNYHGIHEELGAAAEKSVCLKLGWELSYQLLRGAPIALQVAKKAMQDSYHLNLNEALKRESDDYDEVLFTSDRLEALAAFREKREPKFLGR